LSLHSRLLIAILTRFFASQATTGIVLPAEETEEQGVVLKQKRLVIGYHLAAGHFLRRKQRTMLELRKHNRKGRLIAVEGLDGSGKSTQIYLLKRWLEIEGYKVFFTEWNSSVIVKKATKKGKKRQLLTPSTFSLIHCTDFADRYERQIWPLLCAGYIVLADRYFFTAFARDVVRGCDAEWVMHNYSFASLPDVTFYFNIDPGVAAARILESRPRLKYFEAGMDLNLDADQYTSFRIFQGRIHEGYGKLSEEFDFTVIDAEQSVDIQQQIVRKIVRERIDLPAYKWRVRRIA